MSGPIITRPTPLTMVSRHNDMFEIRITSLREFMIFVDIIKGKEVNEDLLREITKDLTKSTQTLENAVEQGKKV